MYSYVGDETASDCHRPFVSEVSLYLYCTFEVSLVKRETYFVHDDYDYDY
jgi:hypothetical protein